MSENTLKIHFLVRSHSDLHNAHYTNPLSHCVKENSMKIIFQYYENGPQQCLFLGSLYKQITTFIYYNLFSAYHNSITISDIVFITQSQWTCYNKSILHTWLWLLTAFIWLAFCIFIITMILQLNHEYCSNINYCKSHIFRIPFNLRENACKILMEANFVYVILGFI